MYMIRRKNLFKRELFSKIYACCFEKEKSGYEISKEIYGYDKKAHYILEILRKHPEIYQKIQHKEMKHPKYKSRATPLVNIICKDMETTANIKRRIKNTIDSKEFRKFMIYQKIVRNHNDMITFISFIAASIYVFRHHYEKHQKELKELGFNIEQAEKISKKAEYNYRKETSLKNDNLHFSDFFIIGTKVGNTFNKLPEGVIQHIINLSPLAILVPKTTIAILTVNDAMWEYKVKKEYKKIKH